MSTFCRVCGNSLQDNDQFCRSCGAPASANQQPTTTLPTVQAQTSVKAVISLVFGLFVFFFPFSIVAIIFGHLSLSEIRKSAGHLKGDGVALAGLILGYVGVAGVPIVLIMAAIAIPNLLRAKMAANESSAVASVRTINTAEVAYETAHPETGYTCTFSDLKDYTGSDLTSDQKNGYRFELAACNPGTNGTIATYQVVAYPVTVNQTGMRAFCSDESTTIKVDPEGSAQNCLQNGQALQ